MSEQVELELKIKGGNKAVKTLGSLERELDKAREAIKGVEVGSKAFETLAQKIQKTGSEIKVLEKNMESLEPQQKAEAFLKLGEGIAGGFAVGQGAMALMGVESENLEKIQVKVQSAISIAMGIRMMSEAALMAATAKRVLIEKTTLVSAKLMSAATAVWTFIQGGLTASITATSIALAALRVAIVATGIGALVLGVIALTGAVAEWVGGTDEATEGQKKLEKQATKVNESLKKQAGYIRERRDLAKKLRDSESDEETAVIKAEQALKERMEDTEHYLDMMKELEDLHASESQINAAKANYEKSLEMEVFYDNQLEKAEDALEKHLKAEADAEERRKKREDKRIKDAEDLVSLKKELDLMRIEDENDRELAKIEQDRQRALEAAVGQEEQIALIKEKYDILENERREKKIADNNAYNQKIADDAIAIKEKQAAKQKEIDQLVEDTKANMISQGFELAKTLGGENKKIQKGIAVSETIFHTQKSIMRALADIPAPWGVAQAALHGAMGAAAIGTILTEKTGDVSAQEANLEEKEEAMRSMIPSAGAFTLGGGVEQQAMKTYVVTDEMSDSQAQLADIRRRSTI